MDKYQPTKCDNCRENPTFKQYALGWVNGVSVYLCSKCDARLIKHDLKEQQDRLEKLADIVSGQGETCIQ